MNDNQCNMYAQCPHNTHTIDTNNVLFAVKKLKYGKRHGETELVSDHIVFACNSLNVHPSILFTAILRHGVTPDGILNGTMVPIPKGTVGGPT